MVITAASFPTPDLIKDTNNPAAWDQLARFADVQAAAANQAVAQLADLIDRQRMPAAEAFRRLYSQISAWRYQVSRQPVGQRPRTAPDAYQEEIGPGRNNIDFFGRGLRRDAGSGAETPASRLSALLGDAAAARFAAEASAKDILDNKVWLPGGIVISGNSLRRGRELMDVLNLDEPIDGLVASYTGEDQDRTVLRQAGFETLARLDEARTAGHLPDLGDPEARRAFADAAYYLYQAPLYHRGSDATTRVLLAAAHTHVFDAVPRLPNDIDVRAYIVGQQSYRDYLDRNLTALPRQAPGGLTIAAAHDQAAAPPLRNQPRQTATYQER